MCNRSIRIEASFASLVNCNLQKIVLHKLIIIYKNCKERHTFLIVL